MFPYQKIDVSEVIDVNKTSASKECELCHYWFFKDIGFKFEEHVCNKCHDLLTIAYSLKDIAILNGKGNYSIDKAAEYYKPNKEAIKEKAKERYKNLEEEKEEKDQN